MQTRVKGAKVRAIYRKRRIKDTKFAVNLPKNHKMGGPAKEAGARRQEMGDGRRETGDRS